MTTGAATPELVTHGFTLSAQHWAWLILKGHKIIENRQCRFAPGWYAVHIGATAYTHVEEELKYHKEFNMPNTMNMQKGHVSGVCYIEASLPYEQCKKNRWAMKDFNVCNIVTEVIPFDEGETVPARGNFGSWPLKEAGPRVEYLTKQAIRLGLRKKTNAHEVFGDLLKEAPVGKAKRPAKEAPKEKGEARPPVKKAKREAGAAPKQEKAPEPVKGKAKRRAEEAPKEKGEACPSVKKAKQEAGPKPNQEKGDIRSFFKK